MLCFEKTVRVAELLAKSGYRRLAKGRGSEVRIEADETDVFWFRDGELVRVQGFPTKAEAVEAVRSSDA